MRHGIQILLLLSVSLTLMFCEIPDTEPPTVEITSPETGTTVNKITFIEAEASDNIGIQKLKLIVDGNDINVVDIDSPYRLAWNTTTYNDGFSYTIEVTAYDKSDNTTTSASIGLIVNNESARPDSVLIDTIQFGDGRFFIRWFQSQAVDFEEYVLYKNTEPVFSTAAVLHHTEDITEVTFYDTSIVPTLTYYYWVQVVDVYGLTNISPMKASIPDPRPNPVDIISVTYDRESMLVVWATSQDGDFESYTLLHAIGEEGERDTVFTQTAIFPTFRVLTGFEPFAENWFWMSVRDTLGQDSVGAGLTHASELPPPQPVFTSVEYSGNSFDLEWVNNYPSDFLTCKLYESYVNDMSGAQEIFRTNSTADTSFNVESISPGAIRFYRLEVWDFWGLFSVSEVIYATSHARFQTIVGGDGADHAMAVTEAPDGGFVVAGYTDSYGAGIDDAWLVKLDISGEEEWDQTYGGSGYDRFHDVLSSTSGSIVASGYTDLGAQQQEEFYLVGVGSDGSSYFDRTYGTTGSDVANSITISHDGGFLIAGYTQSGANGDIYLVKTTSGGTRNWARQIGGSSWEEVSDIIPMSYDTTYGISYAISGYQLSPTGDGREALAMYTDILGTNPNSTIWGGSTHDELVSIIEEPFGICTVGGMTYSSGNSYGQVWMAEYDPSLSVPPNLVTITGLGADRLSDLNKTSDGGYILAGATAPSATAIGDFWFVKLNSILGKEWERTLGEASSGLATAVLQTNDGGYIIVGDTYINGSADMVILKTDPLGNVSGFYE